MQIFFTRTHNKHPFQSQRKPPRSNRTVPRTPLPDIHYTTSINQLKMQCEYLTQEDNTAFKALNAIRKYIPPTMFYTKPMHTQLRSLNRRKWDEEKNRRRSYERNTNTGNTGTPYEGREKVISQVLGEGVGLGFTVTPKRNKENVNMPFLYGKAKGESAREPRVKQKHNQHQNQRRQPVKGFEKMVRELKAILMNA